VLILSLSVSAQSRVPSDINGDGRSELILITPVSSTLEWNAFRPEGGTAQELGAFGLLGADIAFGDWLGSGTPQRATVASTGSQLVWRLENQGQTFTRWFGASGSHAVSGADFNGDDITDAAVVSRVGNTLVWRISTDLFLSSSPTNQSFSLGGTRDQPLFFNETGVRDTAVALSRQGDRFSLRRYDVTTARRSRRSFRARIPSSFFRQAPLPVKGADGKDGLFFFSKTTDSVKGLYVKNHRTSPISFDIAGAGDVLVGDYLSDPGEEVAVHSGDSLSIINPFSRTSTSILSASGIAIDEININLVGRSAPNQPEPPLSPEPPEGGLASVCASVTPILNRQLLIKSEISQHIPGQDPRATGYTVVCAQQCPANLSRVDFFYADGSYAGSVARYGTFHGNGKPRLYGAVGQAPQHFAQEIAARAALIGNGKLYLQMSANRTGSETSCKEFAPMGRNGGLY
jgi:hypothetical protein